jgi:heterogeneous nuclear ribonucleoprotein F/H
MADLASVLDGDDELQDVETKEGGTAETKISTEESNKRKGNFDDADEDIDYDDDEDTEDRHDHKRSRPESCESTKESKPTAFVRLRGLPWDVKVQQVRDFFDGLKVARIHILYNHLGEGYVQLESVEDGAGAIERTRNEIGRRYIEVYTSTERQMEEATKHIKADANYECVVHMRGLPYNATTADICAFFGKEIAAVDIHQPLRPKNGRPNGDSFVMFASAEEAAEVMNKDKVPLTNAARAPPLPTNAARAPPFILTPFPLPSRRRWVDAGLGSASAGREWCMH